MADLVWIIDDDQGILEVTEIVLREAGYDVLKIENETVLDAALTKSKLPNVILLDVLISGIDGRDVGKRLKSLPHTKHIPIILMSANTDIEKKAEEAKADTFLKKPFDIVELEQIVKKYTS